MATMSDFVFPHPDGLATYRVYEDVKKSAVAGEIEVAHGEAIDIAVSPSARVLVFLHIRLLLSCFDWLL